MILLLLKGILRKLLKGLVTFPNVLFMLDPHLGFLHSCPTKLGTRKRASVHIDLPGWTKEGITPLKNCCEALTCNPMEPMVNLAARTELLKTFQTSIVWATLRLSIQPWWLSGIMNSKFK